MDKETIKPSKSKPSSSLSSALSLSSTTTNDTMDETKLTPHDELIQTNLEVLQIVTTVMSFATLVAIIMLYNNWVIVLALPLLGLGIFLITFTATEIQQYWQTRPSRFIHVNGIVQDFEHKSTNDFGLKNQSYYILVQYNVAVSNNNNNNNNINHNNNNNNNNNINNNLRQSTTNNKLLNNNHNEPRDFLQIQKSFSVTEETFKFHHAKMEEQIDCEAQCEPTTTTTTNDNNNNNNKFINVAVRMEKDRLEPTIAYLPSKREAVHVFIVEILCLVAASVPFMYFGFYKPMLVMAQLDSFLAIFLYMIHVFSLFINCWLSNYETIFHENRSIVSLERIIIKPRHKIDIEDEPSMHILENDIMSDDDDDDTTILDTLSSCPSLEMTNHDQNIDQYFTIMDDSDNEDNDFSSSSTSCNDDSSNTSNDSSDTEKR